MGDKFIVQPNGTQPTANHTVPRPPTTGDDRLAAFRKEIFESYKLIVNFNDLDPTEVFMNLSQMSGRANEIRARISEHEGRKEANFRIRVIDPFIEECDRQFRLHSRLQALREMDARLAGGHFT